jgi:hypothetical protein
MAGEMSRRAFASLDLDQAPPGRLANALAVFFGPAAWLGIGLVDGLSNISDQLTYGDVAIPSPPDSVRDWPRIGVPLYGIWTKASENLAAAFREFAPHLKPLAGWILMIAGSAGTGAHLATRHHLGLDRQGCGFRSPDHDLSRSGWSLRQRSQTAVDGARPVHTRARHFHGRAGGTLAHGIVGLLVGPIILAVA